MKRGLKLAAHIGRRAPPRIAAAMGPDEEGNETLKCAMCLPPSCTLQRWAPMKRGLKPEDDVLRDHGHDLAAAMGPDEEGIETLHPAPGHTSPTGYRCSDGPR